MPVGQLTEVLLPTRDFQAVLVFERKSVKLYVVPELSDRYTGVMLRSGRLTPGLSFLIEGEFHFLMKPRYICAITAGLSFRPCGAPGTL